MLKQDRQAGRQAGAQTHDTLYQMQAPRPAQQSADHPTAGRHLGGRARCAEAGEEANKRLLVGLPPGKGALHVSTPAWRWVVEGWVWGRVVD